jgi:hypothetical protein
MKLFKIQKKKKKKKKKNKFQCHCHCHPCHQTFTTQPILPLPHSNYHHSNRLDLLFPTVPLPPGHCHSLSHCHQPKSPATATATQPLPPSHTKLPTAISQPILPLPHSIWYQNDRNDLLYRLIPLPPSHCHPHVDQRVDTVDHLVRQVRAAFVGMRPQQNLGKIGKLIGKSKKKN